MGAKKHFQIMKRIGGLKEMKEQEERRRADKSERSAIKTVHFRMKGLRRKEKKRTLKK